MLVRHRTGGLAMVAVLAALVFSAISGSAPATTAAIGTILIPAMAAPATTRRLRPSIAVSAGVLGPLIPPSIAFVIWGIDRRAVDRQAVPVGHRAGPCHAFGLLVVCYVHAKRNGVPNSPRPWAETREALREWQVGAAVTAGRARRHLRRHLHADRGGRHVLRLRRLHRPVRRAPAEPPGAASNRLRCGATSAIVMAIVAVSTGFGVLIAQEQIATGFAAGLPATSTRTGWRCRS